MMNKLFNDNTISREETQTEAALPFIPSKVRRVSMASVAMCQMLGNKIVNTVLNNEELTMDDLFGVMEFVWLHIENEEKIAQLIIESINDITIVKKEVLKWGMNVSPEEMFGYISEIIKDKQHINNAKSQVIPEAGKKIRKNSRRRGCFNG